MAHTNTRLTVDGKLNVPKIVSQHPMLETLFDEGLEFFVWKSDVELEFPKLPDLAQRALNAKFSVQQGQDIFQVFLRASSLWQSGAADGKADKSVWIIKDIMKANPRCSSTDVQSMVEFARKYTGSSGTLMEPVRMFLSTFKQVGRSVPTSTLQAMAQTKMAPDEMCPHFMTSIIMVLATAPQQGCITAGDVKSICSAKTNHVHSMIEVESIIKRVIDIALQMGLPANVSARLVGEFRTNMILKFFGKVKMLEKETFASLASTTFSNMEVHGNGSDVANPWANPAATGSAENAKDGAADNNNDNKDKGTVDSNDVVEYRDGKAAGLGFILLARKGFKDGELVKFKETGSHHKP
jgi:hypothetical protein